VVAVGVPAYGAGTMQGVDFLAFAEDCTITAKVTMFGDRLTDFLNGQSRFRLHTVSFESLDDGHVVEVDSVSLERSDLLAVVGTGPRGAVDQRVDLAIARMELKVGPYLVLGNLHLAPGVDPEDRVRKREAMVPLTNATIAYSAGGAVIARDVGTVIVNRALVEWIAPTADEATVFPEVEIRAPSVVGAAI
jgi:hypothetical protein